MAIFLRSSWRRWLATFLGAVLAGSVFVSGSAPAHAQGFGWFGGILGGGTPERSPSPPSYPGYRSNGGYFGGGSDDGYRRSRDADDRASRRRAQRHRRAADPAQDTASAPPKKTPLKANATVFVDVFGDTFGLLLANGLDEALADRPEIAVIRKARGPSGLVNTTYYDWPKAIDELVRSDKERSAKKADPIGDKGKIDPSKDKAPKTETAKKDESRTSGAKQADDTDDKPREKIDVAVMMIGSNDRQPIIQDGKTYPRGSDEWTAIYRKRVMAIAEAFQKRKIPLIWVGLPITKDDEFADDMAALNEIYKDAAAKTGATYVDSWEVFSDDKGDFNAFGPDVNGQTVRLRTTDGIFFTSAGARKLAHFVEAHIRRDIDGKVEPPQLPTAEAPSDKGGPHKPGEKASKAPAVATARPEVGPIKNLAEPPSAKGGLLVPIPSAATEGIVETAGRSSSVPSSRADNFRWPSAAPDAAAKAKPSAPAAPK